jgi:hypothetical protein
VARVSRVVGEYIDAVVVETASGYFPVGTAIASSRRADWTPAEPREAVDPPKREPRAGDVWRASDMRDAERWAEWRLIAPASGGQWEAETVRTSRHGVGPGKLSRTLPVMLDGNHWTLITPAPEASPADWRDAYPVGSEVDLSLHTAGRRSVVTHHHYHTGSCDLPDVLGLQMSDGGFFPEDMAARYVRPLAHETAAPQALTPEMMAEARDIMAAQAAFRPPPSMTPAEVAECEALSEALRTAQLACPHCSSPMTRAKTAAVYRCAECHWCGGDEALARAREPERPEPRFKVGDRVIMGPHNELAQVMAHSARPEVIYIEPHYDLVRLAAPDHPEANDAYDVPESEMRLA